MLSSVVAVSVSLPAIWVVIVDANERASTLSTDTALEIAIGALPAESETTDSSTVVLRSSDCFAGIVASVITELSVDLVLCSLDCCTELATVVIEVSIVLDSLSELLVFVIEPYISPLSSAADVDDEPVASAGVLITDPSSVVRDVDSTSIGRDVFTVCDGLSID